MSKAAVEALERSQIAMLASVTSVAEAELCLQAHVDVIDCKNPLKGALGALDHATIRSIVAHVSSRAPVSATIGDLACQPSVIVPAVTRVAATGCDIVKIGFLPGGAPGDVIDALAGADLGPRVKLVAVLFADLNPEPFEIMTRLSGAGFSGVMLDTADKFNGALPQVMEQRALAEFVASTRANGMFSGLAGSLREEHIVELASMRPDVLGFRGALCKRSNRAAGLDAEAVMRVRRAIAPAKNGIHAGLGQSATHDAPQGTASQ